MGSEELEQPQGETKITSLKEYFDELCDYALSIGMSYKEFWEDDVEIFVHYYNAEKIRQKRKNGEMWVQGVYIYNAIGSLAPILNGFSKEHKAQPYMERPIPLTEEERQEQDNQKALKFINQLDKIASKGGKKND